MTSLLIQHSFHLYVYGIWNLSYQSCTLLKLVKLLMKDGEIISASPQSLVVLRTIIPKCQCYPFPTSGFLSQCRGGGGDGGDEKIMTFSKCQKGKNDKARF